MLLESLDNKKYKDLINVECDNCHKIIKRSKKRILTSHRTSKSGKDFCSSKCIVNYVNIGKFHFFECTQCGKETRKADWELNSSKRKNKDRVFCSSSCAAIYNNAHKTSGTRISKLEVFLQSELQKLYPSLDIHFNRKDAINSELDIYIPSLKLAFELNGIFHYEPIYGSDKLSQIQNNDNRKFQACIENGIELCIIDTASQKRFTTQSSLKYLKIITDIIDTKISI